MWPCAALLAKALSCHGAGRWHKTRPDFLDKDRWGLITISPWNLFLLLLPAIYFWVCPECLKVEIIPKEILLNVQYELGNYFEANSPTISVVYSSIKPSFPKYFFEKALHQGFMNQASRDVIPFQNISHRTGDIKAHAYVHIHTNTHACSTLHWASGINMPLFTTPSC